ncbi:MAG: hypothetical protein ABIK25_07410 [Pseudomonadota bacterium]
MDHKTEVAEQVTALGLKGFTFTASKKSPCGVTLTCRGGAPVYECKDMQDALKMAEFRANWSRASCVQRMT